MYIITGGNTHPVINRMLAHNEEMFNIFVSNNTMRNISHRMDITKAMMKRTFEIILFITDKIRRKIDRHWRMYSQYLPRRA